MLKIFLVVCIERYLISGSEGEIMGYYNRVYSGELLSGYSLASQESVNVGPIDTTRDLRITLQLDSVANSADNPPSNPTQTFLVDLYSLSYSDVQDTLPVQQRSITMIGDRAIGSVRFDVSGFGKVLIKIKNNNAFGVYLTIRLTEARLE